MRKTTTTIRRRTADIRRAIAAFDLLCSGTLLSRTKACGRPGCRCASNPEARHGPYFEWTRRHEGRLAHSVISAEQADLLAQAIANYREVQRLLADWERESAAEILALNPKNR